jgi:hypothetical protein
VSPGISVLILWCASVIWCTATLAFSVRSAVLNTNSMVPAEWLTGILNTLALVSGYLLGQLVVSIFEIERWTLACQPTGIEMAAFLEMSRATGLLGAGYGLAYDRSRLRSRPWKFIWKHRKVLQR